ncbi:Alpha/Beta hydrolase protein [Ilyonectria destructans]|nr:Alpha/Beta hydrolase protein [Ilyonectria destructans]
MSTTKRRSRFLGIFSRKALASVEPPAAVSANSADVSGWENSAGASHNLVKASKELDDYFHSIDGSDATPANILQKSRWVEKAQACSNSSFASCSLGEAPLETSRRQLVRLAALSAVKVYAKPGTKNLSPSDFDVIGEPVKIDADLLGGPVKATTAWLYTPKESCTSSSNVIVVAIRGSVTTHDWMVNLNDGAERPVQDAFLGTDNEGGLYSAHSGFLTCAKAINATVVDHIHQLWSNNFAAGVRSKPMLLFTGHSAGGAVAAMLYAHFLECDPISEDRNKSVVLKSAFSTVHCITFGAPPITTKPLSPFQADSVFLSIVNDGDPVPRADNKYINALLRLFSGPMPEEGTKYVLPPRVLFNAGQVVVALDDCRLVRPNEFGAGSLAETVMGNKRAHPMKEYRRRIEQ